MLDDAITAEDALLDMLRRVRCGQVYAVVVVAIGPDGAGLRAVGTDADVSGDLARMVGEVTATGSYLSDALRQTWEDIPEPGPGAAS